MQKKYILYSRDYNTHPTKAVILSTSRYIRKIRMDKKKHPDSIIVQHTLQKRYSKENKFIVVDSIIVS